jgi:hypothetical protein
LREVATGHDITTVAGIADESGVESTARLTPVPSPRPVSPPAPPITRPPVFEVAAPPSAPPPSTNGSAAALIDSSIAALETLESNPFSEPIPIPEDTVVPIEALLYRGRAALDRAVEIRDEIRRAGTHADPVALEELFDLLDLARAE